MAIVHLFLWNCVAAKSIATAQQHLDLSTVNARRALVIDGEDYIIDGNLGSGVSADVSSAKNYRTGDEVAIKFFRRLPTDDSVRKESFDEASKLKAIHEHYVMEHGDEAESAYPMFYTWVSLSGPFTGVNWNPARDGAYSYAIIMEKIPGMTLKQWNERRRPGATVSFTYERDVLDIFAQGVKHLAVENLQNPTFTLV